MTARVVLAVLLPIGMGALTGLWLLGWAEVVLPVHRWKEAYGLAPRDLALGAAALGAAAGLLQTAVWLRARKRVRGRRLGTALDLVLAVYGLVALPVLWFPREPLVTAAAVTWLIGYGATAIYARAASEPPPTPEDFGAAEEDSLPEAEPDWEDDSRQ